MPRAATVSAAFACTQTGCNNEYPGPSPDGLRNHLVFVFFLFFRFNPPSSRGVMTVHYSSGAGFLFFSRQKQKWNGLIIKGWRKEWLQGGCQWFLTKCLFLPSANNNDCFFLHLSFREELLCESVMGEKKERHMTNCSSLVVGTLCLYNDQAIITAF